ncbi:MAG: DUF4416 family protein [Planctomycetota bacterium]
MPMAAIRNVEPVICFCAVISSSPQVRQWGIDQLRQRWGRVAYQIDDLPFEAGGYYRDEMGSGLLKSLVSFGVSHRPDDLADWKVFTNQLELKSVALHALASGKKGHGVAPAVTRPLNLDPGYITQAKLVLATTKDRDHRIYLRDGIFAEVTLSYRTGKWTSHRWTYPDYQTEAVAEFSNRCRIQLRRHLETHGGRRNSG